MKTASQPLNMRKNIKTMKKALYIFLLILVMTLPSVSFAKTDAQISGYDTKIQTLVQKITALQKQLDALLIARQKRTDQLTAQGIEVVQLSATGETVLLRKVDATDHVRGNKNAPIMLVEYSDFECPFCKMFHETLNKIMADYGTTGKVAWVYRHMPIKQIHPNASRIAEASECVTANGGDFWKFADTIFASHEVGKFADISKLEDYAVSAGAERQAFRTCLANGLFKKKVADSVTEFTTLTEGRAGTPQTFVLVGKKTYSIEGAQSYDIVHKMISDLVTK